MSPKLVTFAGTQDSAGSQIYVEKNEDIRTYIAGGTITLGDWVQFDYANATNVGDASVVIIAAVVSTGNPAALGVALESATSGQHVQVQVAGYCSQSLTIATAGQSLIVGGTTAGTAEVQAATDLVGQAGFATATTASGLGPCYIFRKV